MDREPEAAPAHGAPGLLPMVCRVSGSVLTAVGEYLIGAHAEPLVPLPASEQNDDMGNADGQELDEAAAAVQHNIISSEDDQRDINDGDSQHYRHHHNESYEQIAREADDSNGNQPAVAVADDQDETGAAGGSEAGVDEHGTCAIQDLENDQSAAGMLRVGHNNGEGGGEESGEVVVTIESDDSDGESSPAADEVIEHDGGEELAAVVVERDVADGGTSGVVDGNDNDERAGGAAADVPAELRFPEMGGVLEVVRHRTLRALLLMSAFSGALVVILMLWVVSGSLINVGQGQAVLLQFGGGGIMGALNDFRNDNTITGLQLTLTKGKQGDKAKFDVKLDKIDSRSTTSSDGVTWGTIRWPTFGGSKEVAGDKDATVVARTKKKKGGDLEPKRKGFGREVDRLDATKDGRRKRWGRESRGRSQGVGDNDGEYSASGGSILSRVKRLLDAIGSWLRKDMPQADYIFAEGWID